MAFDEYRDVASLLENRTDDAEHVVSLRGHAPKWGRLKDLLLVQLANPGELP
jgi:hypothetical protein